MDALTIGAVIGTLAGVVVFTAGSAGEGVQRVMVGFIVGGVIMGLVQAVIISGAAGVGTGGSLNPLRQSGAGPFGSVVYRGIVLTIEAAVAGGLFMVVSLAPFRAFKGALAGLIIGTVAAFLAWGVLQLIDTNVPLIIFYVLVLGVVLFIIENIPARGGG
jgi:hypothetical protein